MQFNTNEFTYENGTFSADASDFGDRLNGMFGRVFNDACDEGFELISERTGASVKMVLHRAHVDIEGELMYWEFTPYRNDSFNAVHVFND